MTPCDNRQWRAMTGVTEEQFEILLPIFHKVYTDWEWQAYQDGLLSGSRTRAPGGGQKGALPTPREKLFFILYYLKVYPTFDVLAAHFNMARSKANENVYKLIPFLTQTLIDLDVMPKRKFETLLEFRDTIEDIETLLIDVTERNYRRPQENEEQKELYSGKKSVTQSKTQL